MERKKENTRNVSIHHHHHFVPSFFHRPFHRNENHATHSYVQCVGGTLVNQMLRLPQSQYGFIVLIDWFRVVQIQLTCSNYLCP